MSRRIKPTSSFIKRFLVANNVTQKQLCDVSGYSEKQISLILHDKVPVSSRFAESLEHCIPGLRKDFVLEYSRKYQEQLKKDEEFLEKNNFWNISKEFKFAKVFKNTEFDPVEQTNLICESFECKNLNELPSILNTNIFASNVVYSKDSSKVEDYDNKVVNIWTRLIMNQLNFIEDDLEFVGPKKTLEILKENKDLLSTTNSSDLIENIKYICRLCGIYVAFVRSAPTTYIRGLTFSNNERRYIVLTDRFKKIEYVIFAFVHEMMHLISSHDKIANNYILIDSITEQEIDSKSSDFLVDKTEFNKYKNDMNISNLMKIADVSNTTIGVVVAKYHYETKLYNKYWEFLNKFSLTSDLFSY